MPAKISEVYYIHECTERLTQEFTVKELITVFSIETQIEDFDIGDVNAMSIKVLKGLDFDMMPLIGLNVMIVGITTKTVRNIDGRSVFEFYVKENLEEISPGKKRSNRTTREAIPRATRRSRTNTLAQMELTPNQGLSSAFEANPIPNMDSFTVTTMTNDNNTLQVKNNNVI
ncbi:hypothetical protein C1645_835589 [Glomus cerebriforme]|uniref:Uncharacterized protein n=1 Tax=Glomus cerebriforme TaxID=658196 RepID=A0A397SHN2_9GLOM|nr:hypothetical protein C1645_835589 [Glomus cerebriforme]